MKHDDFDAYGTVSRFLHWSMAAGFLFMWATVLAWNINEEYFSLMSYHKSVGFILLILGIFRLLWAIQNRSSRPMQTTASKLGHCLIYLLMLAIPTVAVLRQYGRAKDALDVFGIPVLPAAPQKVDWMMQLGNMLHSKMGFFLIAVIIGHIAAAVFHQIKGEKIMNRMAK